MSSPADRLASVEAALRDIYNGTLGYIPPGGPDATSTCVCCLSKSATAGHALSALQEHRAEVSEARTAVQHIRNNNDPGASDIRERMTGRYADAALARLAAPQEESDARPD